MGLRRATLVAVAVVVTALATTGTPVSADPASQPATAPVSPADVAALLRAADAASAQAQHAAGALAAAGARTAAVRLALDAAAEAQEAAQLRLDRAARAAYEAAAPRLLGNIAPLTPADRRLLTAGATGAVAVDGSLVRRAAAATTKLRRLQAATNGERRRLLTVAAVGFAAEDRARALLVRAELAVAQQRAQVELADRLAALDALAAQMTTAVAPGTTAADAAEAARQAPLLRILEQAGGAIPPGYAGTGQVLRGVSSWYGPGFVGARTSSGAPYDPELLTCAMLTVPLGTVVRISTPDGRAVDALVNDHGPYVAGRLIDVSQAAAARLGFTGLANVTVEVLAPAG